MLDSSQARRPYTSELAFSHYVGFSLPYLPTKQHARQLPWGQSSQYVTLCGVKGSAYRLSLSHSPSVEASALSQSLSQQRCHSVVTWPAVYRLPFMFLQTLLRQSIIRSSCPVALNPDSLSSPINNSLFLHRSSTSHCTIATRFVHQQSASV